ncbi:MAG: hypothetical protein Q4F60_00150, partial [Candidatus Saccharibacteria bacterium]|nr:hypothetical protein [Candidatus Saccharibacteria bacterium]
MKISKKRLFGYGFFAAVLAITMYATTVPDASALEICTAINRSAEGDGGSSSGGEGSVSPGGSEGSGGASVSGNVEVVVKVYSDNPSLVINQPADGSVLATAIVTIKESYSDLDCLNNTITWGDYKANLGDYVPSSLPAYGDYSTSVNLMALGGYGIYNLKATMATYPYQKQQENLLGDQGYLTDNSGFRYAPVTVTYLGTDENGDPVFQVEYDEFTNYVDLDFLQNGKSVLDGTIRTPVEHPGTSGSMIVSIPAGSYGLASGDYTLAATAYGPTADAEVTDTAFDEGTSSITATFDYDEFTDKVYFTVIDANGNVLYLPEAVYTVLNYGTA